LTISNHEKIINYSTCILLIETLLYISCQKKFNCEDCKEGNKPPIAYAGKDTVIILPVDPVMLDGSISTDPDGIIKIFHWEKISGPVAFNIQDASAAATLVKNIISGSYEFELRVTDNAGLWAKDTIKITVDSALTTNHPPTANAGKDTVIILPVNTITLDGRASTDPENNIAGYVWTKIEGPSSFNIGNANAVQTTASNLVEGSYQFDLKVTDAGRLFSKDTIKIVVNTVTLALSCPPSNSPVINAQLVPVGTLSEGRRGMSVAWAGNKILFAGGWNSSNAPSSAVDIYDITAQTWSKSKLSVPRTNMAAIVLGNKIYFAGGYTTAFAVSSRIDVYDDSSNSWSAIELNEPKANLTAAAVGSKIMFTGGNNIDTLTYNFTNNSSNKVEIYNTSTNVWTTEILSISRTGMAATTAGSKIYFAGGFIWDLQVYDQIDIYDNTSNTWSTSAMKERKVEHGSITVGNYIYWAGGSYVNNFSDHDFLCTVEKRNLIDGTSIISHLFQPCPISGTLLKNNSIVFYSGHHEFDIYNMVTDVWSIGKMNRGFVDAGVISVNNIIYIAGGGEYPNSLTNQV